MHMPSVFMLCVFDAKSHNYVYYAKYHYAECRYSEFCYAECHGSQIWVYRGKQNKNQEEIYLIKNGV
jgi:hypothetical protein